MVVTKLKIERKSYYTPFISKMHANTRQRFAHSGIIRVRIICIKTKHRDSTSLHDNHTPTESKRR